MGEIIRKTKNGRFVGWYLRFIDVDGRRKQRASKQPSHAEARRMLIEIEARIARGRVGMEERRRDALTVDELFHRFVAEYSHPRIKDLTSYRRRAGTLLARVGRTAPWTNRQMVSTLSTSQIARLRDALAARYPAGTVRTTLIAVSSALSWGVREGLLEKNPALGVPRPPPPPPRLDFLSADEVRRLLDAAEQRARTTPGRPGLVAFSRWVAIALAVRTGARKGEVFGLRWQDIDLDGQRLTIARSYATTPKSGKPRHLRLPSALVPLLREWRALCPDATQVCPVFHQGSWGMALDTSCEHGLPELLRTAGCRVLLRPWHLLRHSFASHFMQSGGSLLALSQILGHSDVKTTMIYAHLSSDFLAAEIDKVKF
jgi:integrase